MSKDKQLFIWIDGDNVIVSHIDPDTSDEYDYEDVLSNSFFLPIAKGVLPEAVRNVAYNVMQSGGAKIIMR
jgi:hypothetical protein